MQRKNRLLYKIQEKYKLKFIFPLIFFQNDNYYMLKKINIFIDYFLLAFLLKKLSSKLFFLKIRLI